MESFEDQQSSHQLNNESILGILSLLIVPLTVIFAVFVFLYPSNYPPPQDIMAFEIYYKRLGGMVIAVLVLAIFGLVLGIVGILKSVKRKGLALVGLIGNLLLTFIWGAFIAFGFGSIYL